MASRWVPNAPWPKDEVEKLRAWREAGVSYAVIAERLGRTPIAVKAKTRALGLQRSVPYKPVPPQRQPRAEPVQIHRAGPVTLPPLASLQDE